MQLPVEEGTPAHRKRKRSRSKTTSKRLAGLLRNFGWILAGAAVGLPLLALLLYWIEG